MNFIIFLENPSRNLLDFDNFSKYNFHLMSDLKKFEVMVHIINFKPTPTLFQNLDRLISLLPNIINIKHPKDGKNLLISIHNTNNTDMLNYLLEKMDNNMIYSICSLTGGSIFTGWEYNNRPSMRYMIYNKNILEKILHNCPTNSRYLLDLPDNKGYTPLFYFITYNAENLTLILQHVDKDVCLNERHGIYYDLL